MRYLILIIAFAFLALSAPRTFTVTGGRGISPPMLREQSPLPARGEASAEKTIIKTVTAYNAEESQTDSSPEITASGKKVKEGYAAYNCAEFGTKIIINGKEFEVQDRMAKKWGCERIDIFMENHISAINFGIKTLPVIIK